MKKKLLLLLVVTITLLSACGNTTQNYNSGSDVPIATSESSSTPLVSMDEPNIDSTVSSSESDIDNSQPVDIILPMVSLTGETIDTYVETLIANNPSETYSVYNEEYYIQTITEKERLEALEAFSDTTVLDAALESLQSDDLLTGIFVKIETDGLFQNFKLYVNKDAYEQNIFAAQFVTALSLSIISESYQAYNLILPENRITEIRYIDNATGDELK